MTSIVEFHLFGAGGHAREVASEYARRVSLSAPDFTYWVEKGYEGAAGTRIAEPEAPPDWLVTISVGDPELRKRIVDRYWKWAWATYVSDKAFVPPNFHRVSLGVYVAPLAYVGEGAVLGEHVLVNHGSHVSHDCVVEPYCHIAIGAMLCGGVYVGEMTEIGAGAVILPKVRIGERCRIGAGSVVTKDVPDDTILRGQPSRIERRR